MIFDPLRTWFISNKITKRYDVKVLWQKVKRVTHGSEVHDHRFNESLRCMKCQWWQYYLNRTKTDSKISLPPWGARAADEDQLRRWLHSPVEKIMVLTGPKGAGKEALVAKVTSGRPNILEIDVGPLLDRTDDEFINGFANAVGT